jgi:hypothetical protein
MSSISYSAFSSELRKLAEKHHKVPLEDADHHLFEAIKKKSPVKVLVTPDAVHYGGGYFDQAKKEIGLSEEKFESLAHEVGHAQIDEHLLGRLIQHQVVRGASSIIPSALAGIGAGILMAKGKAWGLLLPAALSAPTILSEVLASHKGKTMVEAEGGNAEQVQRYRGKMREGLSTYALAPALGTLIAAGMQIR